MTTVVIPTVTNRGRFAFWWRCSAWKNGTPRDLDNRTPLWAVRPSCRSLSDPSSSCNFHCSLFIHSCAYLSHISHSDSNIPRCPWPPSSPALFWLQLFLPPSSPLLWKTPLYWGSNSSQFVPHKPVFSFTRWMFLLCADWTSHVWSHLPAGFRWILCGGSAPHIASCPLIPEKESFIEISGHMSGVFAPQFNVIFRPFTKYKDIVLNLLTLAQFTEYNRCNRFIRLEWKFLASLRSLWTVSSRITLNFAHLLVFLGSA